MSISETEFVRCRIVEMFEKCFTGFLYVLVNAEDDMTVLLFEQEEFHSVAFEVGFYDFKSYGFRCNCNCNV